MYNVACGRVVELMMNVVNIKYLKIVSKYKVMLLDMDNDCLS